MRSPILTPLGNLIVGTLCLSAVFAVVLWFFAIQPTIQLHEAQASRHSEPATSDAQYQSVGATTAQSVDADCELLSMRVINYVQENGVAIIVYEDMSIRRVNDAPIRADLHFAIEFVNAMPDDSRFNECADGFIGESTYS